MNTRFFHLTTVVVSLLSAATVRAQLYDVKATNSNWLYAPYTAAGAAATPAGPITSALPTAVGSSARYAATLDSNFQGMGLIGGSSGVKLGAFPAYAASSFTFKATDYPSNALNSIVTTSTLALGRSTIGGAFSSGLPRFALGDVITPPLVKADGSTPAPAGYWRSKPVAPGEVIDGATPVVDYRVSVTASSTNSLDANLVSVNAATAGDLTVGATLLGQPIIAISDDRTLVTLAGNANQTISNSAGTSVVVTPALAYYYSPHGEKVYASQPGRVTITWVSLLQVNDSYETKSESFTVASTTTKPVRTIFWTEGSFDAPAVAISDGRISTVNPIYNTSVPKAVANEVSVPGYLPMIPNLKTLYFERFNGNGAIRAYNVEGRILIEYLGAIRAGNDIYTSLGIDVVDLVRSPAPYPNTTYLGQQILPHDAVNGSTPLKGVPKPVRLEAGGGSYYASNMQDDGVYKYFAERETGAANSPDNGSPASADAYNKVLFYWLQTGDFGIRWPKFLDSYWLRWSPNLSDYAFNTVAAAGSTADNGLQFTDGLLPTIVYQDDPAQTAAKIDSLTQRLCVTFPASSEGLNRALLKFSSGMENWYMNLYTQAETRSKTLSSSSTATTVTVASTADLRVGMTVTGSGISGSATIIEILDGTRYLLSTNIGNSTSAVIFFYGSSNLSMASTYSTGTSTITLTAPSTTSGLVVGMTVSDANGNYLGTIRSITDNTHYVLSTLVTNTTGNWTYTVEDGGGAALFNSPATVGTRINPPAGYENGGYLSGGTGYHSSAYIDPIVSGVKEGNKGAIIPVNAMPSNDVLTVRWFKKIAAPSAAFKDQYVPGKIGRYKVTYPTAPSQIVIAQGIGSGDLLGAEASGTIYVQNDVSQPGYNPNEEHALIRSGRAYALRDDLNIYSNTGRTQPASGYKTANYTSEPYVLVSFTDASDQRPQMRAYQVVRSNATYDFCYTATAGTLLSKPYPLPLLPPAMVGKTAKDVEIWSKDTPTNTLVQTNEAYKSFTFQDRKGFTWVHRGPHSVNKVLNATATASATVTVPGTTGLTPGMTVTGTGITGIATIVSITNSTQFVLSQAVTVSSQAWTFKPTLSMKLYYTLQGGFFVPGYTLAAQPQEGTVLPFLRNSSQSGLPLDLTKINAYASTTLGADGLDAPLPIFFNPEWPTSAPEMRVGETLTLANHGLPQVRGQQSAQVLYQQSIAKATNTLDEYSVVLFDPTSQKTVDLDSIGMTKLPSSIATASYKGKTYFQKLPPDLQQRFYYDPLLSASANGRGSLVFKGVFHEEITGDSYLDLNTLSADQEAILIALETTTGSDHANWVKAIQSLKAPLTTYYENPSKLGTYIADPLKSLNIYAASDNQGVAATTASYTARWSSWKEFFRGGATSTATTLSEGPIISSIHDSDTKVDSYALTATGQGAGYVTMVFNNGRAFTDVGNPVTLQVFKIASELYPGELKVINSSNPLDEQVTLRHTADFGGHPDEYEYDWRYSDGAPSAPATYSSVMTPRVGDPATSTHLWTYVSDPGAMLPTVQQYSQLSKPLTIGGTASVCANPRAYLANGSSGFTLTPTSVSGTTVTVANTGQLMAGMSVTGSAISGTATIVSVTNATSMVLSTSPTDTSPLTFTASSNVIDQFVVTPSLVNGTSVTLNSTALMAVDMRVTWVGSNGPARVVSITDSTRVVLTQAPPAGTALTFQAVSYTDDEIAAGFPGLVLKSNTGVDFSGGVPGKIVFSATLGALDGCVLYVNGKAAMAYNAPSPAFTSVNASTGLTQQGLSKQFGIEPRYFTAGVNTVEVAVYTTTDPNSLSAFNFKLEAAQETDLVNSSGSAWQKPGDFDATKLPDGADRTLSNIAIIGGASSNPFGGAQFVLNDRWFTLRYRPKASANNVLGTPWSRWTQPQFTEGWLKRVLAAINPFTQRVKDLYNNAVNTDVSMLTQAGTRWEGDLALNMDNINDNGLIAIYETVLNRAKSMSIDAGVDDPDTNRQLLLAAGYLNDLYTILGNEAAADAADSTVALDTFRLDTGAVATSRFSFEAQVASSLDEEMALLRGRDNSVSPGVITKPFYNRLVWNYTRGINSGEAIYASNYNIKEKVGSSTANGVIDAADAQRMFPQGHGDAYGHYLTALTGYYRLLWNDKFTWKPSAEAVTVLGVPVTVDFQDERKFAAAAAHLASTAEQICALTYRQNYKDDPKAGWSQFQDKDTTRGWALDEQVSRSTQGAFFNWTMANALVPDVDTVHTGVQKIDRTTVLELALLPAAATSFQSTLDNANARLNPLGLSPGAIPFDIDPSFANSLGQEQGRVQGKSQFLQMYDRSLRALNNAAGAFSQAASMSRALRDQTNTVDDYAASISQQEFAYNGQLIDIFGTPYTGDTTFSSDYTGPDLFNFFIVDRPNDLVDTSQPVSVTIEQRSKYNDLSDNALLNATKTGLTLLAKQIAPILGSFVKVAWNEGMKVDTESKTVNINPSSLVQYNDVWKTGGMGSRRQTGELQHALVGAQQSLLAIHQANNEFKNKLSELKRKSMEFDMMVMGHGLSKNIIKIANNVKELQDTIKIAAKNAEQTSEIAAEAVKETTEAAAEGLPTVVGPLAVDATAPARSAIESVGLATKAFGYIKVKVSSAIQWATEKVTKYAVAKAEAAITDAEWADSERALQYEMITLYNEVTTQEAALMSLTVAHQRALEDINNIYAKGNRLLLEREIFRQRAAAIIQGYRTNDMTFRTFRNEALEQYRSLFDLASRYTYMAAKAYDYETGLLGTSQGKTVFSKIVASRSLGDLTGGTPQSTTSTLGDAGLAGSMAQLDADFSVAEGRLGINNPDYYGTVFSLRGELFRLMDDPDETSDDDAWRQTLEQHVVSNVLNDSDVATQCLNIKKSNGSAVPGIIIPFSSCIEGSKNFFGKELAAYDHAYSVSSFATVISNAGMVFSGYVGMDSAVSSTEVTAANSAYALSATPYAYLIPCGNDVMRAPPLGDTDTIRTWTVQDQALPLPYNLGANDFNSTQFFNATGTLSSQPWIIRKHQAFRAVANPDLFTGAPPLEFSSARLIGRSAWNTRWKIVIPANTLSANEQDALNRFVSSVTDIKLYLRTYSHSGN
ncbi:MAG: hypothetical protein QE267_07190 [Akkermansiaceae bacterium]|nr:hypothetical protein [Akkermansiaceae bacterium]